MNDLERIQNEIITILILIVTLTFTSCNLTSESLEDKSLAERLPVTEANN